MNHDMKLLAMLLGYSQRRMVAVVGQVESCLGCDTEGARAALARLERHGLLYVEGVTVRLTLPGFAYASAMGTRATTGTTKGASVHRLGRRPFSARPHAA